jgi:predicted ATPase/class 3 adenylate cyclase
MDETASPHISVMTFLFSDVEGSTRLLERYPTAQPLALKQQDRILTDAARRHGGTVMEVVGDGYYIAFPRATDAFAAALESQIELQTADWGEVGQIRVRMGLHTGEAERRGEKYFGPPLYRCARLMALAHGGQVVLSRATAELVRGALPVGVELRPLGAHRLRDLQEPEEVFQLIHPSLPEVFPPLRSSESRPNNLPAELTAFVGRDEEQAEVARLLETARLVTITGPGGIGKTRLALTVATQAQERFAQGTFLVDLTAVADPVEVPAAIGRTLRIKEPADETWTQALQQALKSANMLLILDNFEQLIPAAPTVAALLASCSGLRFIVTTRQSLQITGERELPLGPLELPGRTNGHPADALAGNASVALFVQRAQSVRPAFALTDQNAPLVADICRHLDGLPLAIELAAARTKVMQPRELLTKLADSSRSALALLKGGPQDASPRHQTLQAAIDWSYQLLEPAEQQVFRQLAVFLGGWTAEAAEAVCLADPAADVTDMLFSLVDKSLIRLTEGSEDESRYTMLSTIWQYAVQQMTASGEEEGLRERHAAFYASFAETAGEQLVGTGQAETFRRLTLDRDNLLAALRWSAASGGRSEGLRIVGALWRFWGGSGHAAECLRLGRELLGSNQDAPPATRATTLNAAGNLAFQMGDTESARGLYEACVAMRRDAGDMQAAAGTLNNLGLVARERGDADAARQLFEESLAAYRTAGQRFGVALVLSNLGILAADQGDDDAARELEEESLALRRTLGDQHGAAANLQNLAEIAMRARDFERSLLLLRESFAIHNQLGDHRGTAYGLESLASLALAVGECEHAVCLFGTAEAARTAIGMALLPTEAEEHARFLESARAALPADRYAEAFQRGASLSPAAAAALPFPSIE